MHTGPTWKYSKVGLCGAAVESVSGHFETKPVRITRQSISGSLQKQTRFPLFYAWTMTADNLHNTRHGQLFDYVAALLERGRSEVD
jgi:hypothetical protein